MYGIHVMVQLWHCIWDKGNHLSSPCMTYSDWGIWGLVSESIERTPLKIKKQTCCLLKYGPHKPQLPARGCHLINMLSSHLITFTLHTLTLTHAYVHICTQTSYLKKKKTRTCNIATPDSIRQCPWHWQRSNSEFRQVGTKEIQEYVHDS